MKNKKKVVLLIVEGESEEGLLYKRLRNFFEQHEIRFEVQHGDILSDSNTGKGIKRIIGDTIKQFLTERKFKDSDILAVLHIIDTDGCLIEDDSVVIDNSQEVLTYYHENCITVPDDEQRQNIVRRNQKRKVNINTMNSINAVLSGKIMYRMFYFSRHLEHVLFNEPNPEDEGKIEKVDRFLDSLPTPIEDFLIQYMPELNGGDTQEDYMESWKKISQSNASLKRGTNVPLLFEFIQNETDNLSG